MIKLNGKEYFLKLKWADHDFNSFKSIVLSKNTLEKVSICSGIELELVQKLTIEQLHYLTGALGYADDWHSCLLQAKEPEKIKVSSDTYYKLEKSKQILKGAESPISVLDKLSELYYGATDDFFLLLGQGMHVLTELGEFLERYKDLNSYEPTIEELEAGIEYFYRFGNFPTVINLARKYGTTHDAILHMAADEVYMTLLIDMKQAEYENNLSKIRSRKK